MCKTQQYIDIKFIDNHCFVFVEKTYKGLLILSPYDRLKTALITEENHDVILLIPTLRNSHMYEFRKHLFKLLFKKF